MTVYSVKNDETLAIRAFSCTEKAYNWGYKQQIFSTQEELYNTNLTDAQLKEVYRLITGFETRVQYRDYLCELIFNAIEAAGLPLTDVDGDCAILSDKKPVEPESVDSEPEPIELAYVEDAVPGIVHLFPDPPAINPDPETIDDNITSHDYDPATMEPDLSFVELEPAPNDPDPVTDKPPTMDPNPAAFLKLIVNNTFDEPETKKRVKNAMIYGTSHPEMYKTAPKIDKKDLVLSDTPKTKYSRREKSIFETIVEAYPEPITTRDIIERKFKSYKKYHVKNAIAVTTKSLASKIAYNEEPFLLKIGGNSGPKPMSVWIEEKGEYK